MGYYIIDGVVDVAVRVRIPSRCVVGAAFEEREKVLPSLLHPGDVPMAPRPRWRDEVRCCSLIVLLLPPPLGSITTKLRPRRRVGGFSSSAQPMQCMRFVFLEDCSTRARDYVPGGTVLTPGGRSR